MPISSLHRFYSSFARDASRQVHCVPAICASGQQVNHLRSSFVSTVLMLVAAGLIPLRVDAALHTGNVELYSGQGWDFSDSLIAGGAPADIVFDVSIINNSSEPRGQLTDLLCAMFPAAIVYIGNADSTYEKLGVAPTDLGVYRTCEAAWVWDVFVVRTRELHYAKMRIIPFGTRLRFEYTYQDDGSPSFVPGVPVRSTTWGRIKALYRND